MGNHLSEPVLADDKSEYGTTEDDLVQWATLNVQGWRKT